MAQRRAKIAGMIMLTARIRCFDRFNVFFSIGIGTRFQIDAGQAAEDEKVEGPDVEKPFHRTKVTEII